MRTMVTKKDLLFHTFIGLDVEVVRSTQIHQKGIKGKIVDETKNMIIIDTGTKEIKLQKNANRFRFFVEDGHVDVDGSSIAYRPHERPKKV